MPVRRVARATVLFPSILVGVTAFAAGRYLGR